MNISTITSWYKFIDIDAFACIYAYKELLQLQHKNVEAVISATLNESITQKYRSLDFYTHTLWNKWKREFIIMDVSDPSHFEKFVDLNKISNIFDHHPWFENYRDKKIWQNAIIKPIGAAATLIYEEYQKYNLLKNISPLSAELLGIAIVSNTLNFQARITLQEDIIAYDTLKRYFDYFSNSEQWYYNEVQSTIENNIINALHNDSKLIHSELFIAQLEVRNAEYIKNNYWDIIKDFLSSQHVSISFLNIIEIGKWRNIIICNDEKSLHYLQWYFPEFTCNENNNTIITPHVLLRKEILTRIYQDN